MSDGVVRQFEEGVCVVSHQDHQSSPRPWMMVAWIQATIITSLVLMGIQIQIQALRINKESLQEQQSSPCPNYHHSQPCTHVFILFMGNRDTNKEKRALGEKHIDPPRPAIIASPMLPSNTLCIAQCVFFRYKYKLSQRPGQATSKLCLMLLLLLMMMMSMMMKEE